MKINWTHQAKEDLNFYLTQLEKISPTYASNFDEKVRDAIITLSKFPQMGRIFPETNNTRIREKIIGKYHLIYLIKDDDNIEIIAIIHGSMNLSR